MEYAIIFLPLIGSIFGYLGRSITKFFSEIFTSLFVSISAIFSIVVFWNGIESNNYGNYQIVEWISSGDFIANWSINIDPLSSVMLALISFVLGAVFRVLFPFIFPEFARIGMMTSQLFWTISYFIYIWFYLPILTQKSL